MGELEEIATWLETTCPTGALWERCEIAAMLRLGAWKEQEPFSYRSQRWIPSKRAEAEQSVARSMELEARRREIAAAMEAGAEPMVDAIGRPLGTAVKSMRQVMKAFGVAPSEEGRAYEYLADGTVRVFNGLGELIQTYRKGHEPRANTRLKGHAFRMIRCLQCKPYHKGHGGCECGEWHRRTNWDGTFASHNDTATEMRQWHRAHKEEVRRKQ